MYSHLRRAAVGVGLATAVAGVLRARGGRLQADDDRKAWTELDLYGGPDVLRITYPTKEHLALVKAHRDYLDE